MAKAAGGGKRRKSAKKKMLIGAKMLKRQPAKNIPEAIEMLNSIAKRPGRRPRMRKAALTMARLLAESPKIGHGAVEKLLHIEAEKGISLSTVCRIFASPLAFTTLKGKLRDISRHKGEFKQLFEAFENLRRDVQWAYKKRIPPAETRKVLECERGKFYEKLLLFATSYRAPKSFVTNLVITRMQYLGLPAEAIAEAEKIKWGMHNQSHKWHEAKRKGNKEAMKRARGKVRELHKIFDEKFTKTL